MGESIFGGINQNIYIDAAQTIQSFLIADPIDEITLTTILVLLQV
jgi:hypothetical protein